MNKTKSIQNIILSLGIPFLIIGLMIAISKSSAFQTNQSILSTAITFDLLLIVPFIYFLLIRNTKIPKTTVIPFVILGIVVCTFILPSENQYYLNLFKIWILPILELSVLAFISYNLWKGIKRFKLNKESTFDFFTTLKTTSYEILPKVIVIPVVTEITVFYYAFFDWKKRALKENEFSYHKTSGTISLLVAIIILIAVETAAIHILLSKWNTTVAWILTFLSIYSIIQILGFLKSMFKRPISIANGKLQLRYGIMNETTVDLKDIESIELSSKEIELNKETRKLSIFGALESHNVVIYLKKEHTLIGLYGIKRRFKIVALHIDDKTEFESQLKNALDLN